MSNSLQLSDFAPELLQCVFCFSSPSDLASLSRVNYTFQQTAEYLLYRHIHVSFGLFTDTTPRSLAQKSLFYTLTSNPQKASLLGCLHVQLEFDGNFIAKEANYLLLERIVDALQNAHSLVDLRISMVYRDADAFKGRLSEVIKSGSFQLHTLYSDSYQDLEGIIVSQKHLRLLGIHNDHYYGYIILSKLINNRRNSLINSNGNFPGIFMLTCCKPSYDLSQLILFPELCLPGQALMLCRDIATSLGQDLGRRYDAVPVDRNCTLGIRVFDFSDTEAAIICEVVEAMARCFVDCQALTIWAQSSNGKGKETVSKPWRIPGVLTSVSRFKQLQRLDFYVSSDDWLSQAAIDLRSLLKEFVHTGLTVARVCFDDYSMFAQLASDLNWEAEIMENDSEGDNVYLDMSVID